MTYESHLVPFGFLYSVVMCAEQFGLSKGSLIVAIPSWLKTATRRLMKRQMKRGIYADDFENSHFKERGIYAGKLEGNNFIELKIFPISM
jgi:trans-aconitate methyltransferase